MVFTIIIPTHERPLLLHRTLESLAAQTYRQFTAVVVADSSMYLPPHQDLATLPDYVYVLRGGQSGPATSRNMALDLVRSEYVIFLDDDDTFEPGHLQSLADILGRSRPDILFTDFKVIEEDRISFPPQRLNESALSIADVTVDSVFVRNRIPNSALVYRRKVVDAVRFDAALPIYEDWDFLLSCLKRHKLTHAPIDSLCIHKSYVAGVENQRRGNTQDEQIIPVMLALYKRHQAKNMATRLARQKLMADAGMALPIERF